MARQAPAIKTANERAEVGRSAPLMKAFKILPPKGAWDRIGIPHAKRENHELVGASGATLPARRWLATAELVGAFGATLPARRWLATAELVGGFGATLPARRWLATADLVGGFRGALVSGPSRGGRRGWS
jgi:hypothetical protein